MGRLLFCGVMAITLMAGVGRGDRLPAPGRVVAGSASPGIAPPGTGSLPRFALFGWVSPPRDSTTAARYAELAEAGFNLTVLAWEDTGSLAENRARLAYTRPHGVQNLLLDQRLERIQPGKPTNSAVADTIAADYAGDPAFLGYYLGDEPGPGDYGGLSLLFQELRERDPAHPAWNNLFGRMHYADRETFLADTRAYVRAVRPSVLCNDHYDFLLTGDRGWFVQNVAGLASVAREEGLPFWGIVQLVQHRSYRAMTPALLRWQVAHLLAHGARGVGYFTYWTPAPDTFWQWQPSMIAWGSGARTPWYYTVKSLNAKVRPIGEQLAGLQWLTTEYAGSLPLDGTAFSPDSVVLDVQGRAALGTFVDSVGTPFLLVALSDSLARGTVRLTQPQAHRFDIFVAPGVWAPLPNAAVAPGVQTTLELDAGDFVLLRASEVLASSGAGDPTLRLSSGGNPARGSVRFALAGVSGGARLELLDAHGRRVWLQPVSPGTRELVWDGKRDSGGPATPGVYFARLEGPRGVRVTRVVWLGAR